MPQLEYTEPNVCVGENITTDDTGQLRLQPWSTVRLVADVKAMADDGDGRITKPLTALPGKLLIDQKVSWRNDSPLPAQVLITVTRSSRYWLTSNPNAIQIRDRWTTAIDTPAGTPITTSIYNSRCGSAVDIGTNSVAEPEPGRQWRWADAFSTDEWLAPIDPESTLNLWYRCYAWTPPPWSDNSNKSSPQHQIRAGWTRISLHAFPQQGNVVTG
jgi:hypothetical protein